MKTGRPDYDGGRALIPAEEPVFILRAQDRFAEDTIRYYANLVASHHGESTLTQHARQQADAVAAWPTKKDPDFPKV